MLASKTLRDRRLATLLGAAGLYVGGYVPLHSVIGNSVGMLVAVPVMMGAWMYGAWVGVLSLAAALVTNTLLANLTGTPGILAVVHRGGILAFLMMLPLTAMVGLLRDAGIEIKRKNEALAASLHELEQAQEKLIRGQKLAVMEKLAGALQHDINNPLASVSSNLTFIHEAMKKIAQILNATAALTEAGLLSKDERLVQLAGQTRLLLKGEEELESDLRSAADESIESIERIALLLASFSRLQQSTEARERVELDGFLAETFATLPPTAATPGDAPVTLAATGAAVRVNKADVRQAIQHVLSYFRRSRLPGGPVHVRTRWLDKRPALSISHPGLILDAAQRRNLVDPLIRVDLAENKMRADLELAFAFQLSTHGGAALQVSDGEEGGTAFQFVFDAEAR